MPEETVSALEGANPDNGAALQTQGPDSDQSNPIQSDQVNLVCPTCEKVPSQPLVKHYIGQSTDGSSHNHFGDIIVYCCSHCARHSQRIQQEPESQPQVSSRNSDSAPSPTQAPSRTLTLETLPSISERIALPLSHHDVTTITASNGCEIAATTGNNSAGRGSGPADEPASLSLIGLKIVQESDTEAIDWEGVYSADADFATLNIEDAHISEEKLRRDHEYPFIPLSCDWGSCIVSIERNQKTGFRRLNFKEDKACELWIPDTRIRVSCIGSTVILRFSNCNKLQPPGYYQSENGTALSVATYHPEKPNVKIEVRFVTPDAASTFRDHILCRKFIDEALDDAYIQQSPPAVMMHSTRDTHVEEQRPCILVWKQEVDEDTDSEIEIHDVVALTDKLDLVIATTERDMHITGIGFVGRLTYYPAFDQPDLPQNVKRTLDGAPTESSIEREKLASNEFRLTTSTTEVEHLINYILSRTLSWRLAAIFHKLDVKVSSSRIWKLGSDSYAAQLTLWSDPENRAVRVSVRTSGIPETDQNSKSKAKAKGKGTWFSIMLRETEDLPTASLKQNTLTIKKVRCEAGHCLSTKNLQPIAAETRPEADGDGNNADTISLELKFNNSSEVQRFREVVTDHFLNNTDC